MLVNIQTYALSVNDKSILYSFRYECVHGYIALQLSISTHLNITFVQQRVIRTNPYDVLVH